MAEQQASPGHDKHDKPPRGSKNIIHRVCIQCNHMFVVTPENFDAKQCPDCHKG